MHREYSGFLLKILNRWWNYFFSIKSVIAQPPPWKGGKGDVLLERLHNPTTILLSY
nr:MAG TPA: hypothetical protein [Caudoviricetes sp.]